MACHAVRLLASAPKDHTSSEHADWGTVKVALGEALVEIPDYAHCVHTRVGQELERGLMQWWDNGAQVRDELPSADHRYREELIDIHRRDEAENGTAPRPARRRRARRPRPGHRRFRRGAGFGLIAVVVSTVGAGLAFRSSSAPAATA